MSKTLSIADRQRFNTLRKRIRVWWDDRLVIGEALAEIRDGKLYRDDYGSFEDFCQIEYQIKRAQAYRLIYALQVTRQLENDHKSLENNEKVSPMGDKIENERQARELKNVAPEKRTEVVETAAKSGKVTAKSLAAAAKKIGEKEPVKDDTGYPVPPRALPFWERKKEVEDIARLISKARSAIKALPDEDTMFAEVKLQSVLADLNNAYREFKQAVPYAVCPVCQGQTPKSCTLCKGRAVISKFKWETAVPEELKKIRAKK